MKSVIDETSKSLRLHQTASFETSRIKINRSVWTVGIIKKVRRKKENTKRCYFPTLRRGNPGGGGDLLGVVY
jgi:hypothetical protein